MIPRGSGELTTDHADYPDDLNNEGTKLGLRVLASLLLS